MKKEDISHLSIMDRMVKDGNSGIMMSTSIQDVYTVKPGAIVAFGVTREVGSDASVQREFGLPGENMLMCFAVNRKQLEETREKMLLEINRSSKPRKYFVAYKPDASKSFFHTIQKPSLTDPDGEILDHIMQLADGDLGNYEIYEHIIG